jgi:predicted aspartyl protease
MHLLLERDLPFVSVQIVYHGAVLDIPHILVDTGSATTLLSADMVEQAGITPQADDRLRNIYGVGGIESVFMRQLNSLQVGENAVEDFEIDVGGMDYAPEFNGILGMNFLLKTGAIIDLNQLTIEFVR